MVLSLLWLTALLGLCPRRTAGHPHPESSFGHCLSGRGGRVVDRFPCQSQRQYVLCYSLYETDADVVSTRGCLTHLTTAAVDRVWAESSNRSADCQPQDNRLFCFCLGDDCNFLEPKLLFENSDFREALYQTDGRKKWGRLSVEYNAAQLHCYEHADGEHAKVECPILYDVEREEFVQDYCFVSYDAERKINLSGCARHRTHEQLTGLSGWSANENRCWRAGHEWCSRESANDNQLCCCRHQLCNAGVLLANVEAKTYEWNVYWRSSDGGLVKASTRWLTAAGLVGALIARL